jgi:PAS domain S-box-containing protein
VHAAKEEDVKTKDRPQANASNADVPSFNWTQDASALLSAIVDCSDDAIISKDLNSIITSWNKSAERLFGYTASEAIGRSITMIIPPDRLDEEPKIIEQLKRGERVDHFETVRMRKDGSRFDISLTISPVRDNKGRIVGASKVARDVTERKHSERRLQEFNRELEKLVAARTSELEQANRALLRDLEEREKLEHQLRESQKLEGLGNLASGVAHDFNNLLNIIQGYASMLGPEMTDDEIQETIEAINETTNRGAGLVKQLLALARKAEIRPEPVDINKIVNELTGLIKGAFPKDIDISLDLAPKPLTIMADTSQITQVLLNVCVNARDAMPNGGTLRLKTSVVDGTALEVPDDLQGQSYAAIEVIDTGMGMKEGVLSKIFEPFFTTKEVGKGTGLGLAVAYGIVKSHSGVIQVESEPLHGTSFHLYFPMVSASETLLGAERK